MNQQEKERRKVLDKERDRQKAKIKEIASLSGIDKIKYEIDTLKSQLCCVNYDLETHKDNLLLINKKNIIIERINKLKLQLSEEKSHAQ